MSPWATPPTGNAAEDWRCVVHKRWLRLMPGLTAFLVLILSGCGYNTIQSRDAQVKAAWSEVVNQYQRRSDLVPNLVDTVRGYASHEQEVFTQVTEARARVGTIGASPELLKDPQAFARFQEAQGHLSGSLSRLLAISENYPQLRADTGFRDLQAQLEGAENHITAARNRYIQAVQAYNATVRSFPSNLTALALGYKPKPDFTVANQGETTKPPPAESGAPSLKTPGSAY